MSQLNPKNQHSMIPEAPTDISATARLITRNMMPLRKLRSLRKMMITRAFNITVAKAWTPNTVSQVMQSGVENKTKGEIVLSCCE